MVFDFFFGPYFAWYLYRIDYVKPSNKEKTTMNGFDLFILSIASTTAIFMVGFAAKVYCILRKDLNRGQSVLELKPTADSLKKND